MIADSGRCRGSRNQSYSCQYTVFLSWYGRSPVPSPNHTLHVSTSALSHRCPGSRTTIPWNLSILMVFGNRHSSSWDGPLRNRRDGLRLVDWLYCASSFLPFSADILDSYAQYLTQQSELFGWSAAPTSCVAMFSAMSDHLWNLKKMKRVNDHLVKLTY